MSPASGMNPASSQAVRVLIAEDDRISRMVVVRMIQMLGGSCVETENGREAVEAYRAGAGEFDLLLLDIEMPEMDGLEAATALQVHFAAAGRKPHIVALTGEVFDEKLAKYRAAGFDACLGKPLKFERLQSLFGELNLV